MICEERVLVFGFPFVLGAVLDEPKSRCVQKFLRFAGDARATPLPSRYAVVLGGVWGLEPILKAHNTEEGEGDTHSHLQERSRGHELFT